MVKLVTVPELCATPCNLSSTFADGHAGPDGCGQQVLCTQAAKCYVHQ